jgi:protein tyrosine/serine phosphatase
MDAASARRILCERYATVPFRPILVTVYRAYFQALATMTTPSLVYCTAGKDRTGVLVALLHSLLGVHPEDLLADYLLTNTVGDVDARIAVLRADLQRRFGAAMNEEAVRVLTSVEPLFLDSAFDAIKARHGTVSAYLEQVLGVTPALREQIAAQLIA